MKKMKKIYCIEEQKDGFDDIAIEDVKEMIGYIEPFNEDDGTVSWHVTLRDSYYETKDQDTAMIIAGSEMTNAILMLGLARAIYDAKARDE